MMMNTPFRCLLRRLRLLKYGSIRGSVPSHDVGFAPAEQRRFTAKKGLLVLVHNDDDDFQLL